MLLLALGGLAHAGPAGVVDAMTVVDAGGWTRASIDVADDTRFDVFALAHPDRLVVDLHRMRLGDDFRVPGPDGMVTNVRTGEPVPGDVRLVFDLEAKVRPKAALRHEEGRTRLVIEMRDAAGLASARPGGSPARVEAAAAPADAPQSGRFPIRTDAEVGPTEPAAADGLVSTGKAGLPTPVQPAVATRNDRTPAGNGATIDSAVGDAHGRAVKAVDPSPVSTAAAVPMPAAADESPDTPPVPAHPGARTVRDVLGAGQRKIVIAVDAGHGGQDVGAKGYSGTYEKNVTLATARELARQINAEPGLKAVLTRDGDYFVPLAERYHKAREAKADLFISVHCDAEPGHDATGSSVWVLSERGVTSQAAKWLADRENAADLVGGVRLSDKDNTLASVLLDLSQSATMKASEDAAERVHQALRDIGRTHKAHPERANFVVLRSPDVPSMLVETAFITNQDEEERLNDPAYRARLAAAVLSGVKGYFTDTPLPGTEFAALHARGSRDTRRVAIAAPLRRESPDAATAADADDGAQAPAAAAPVMLATADAGEQVHVVQRGEHLRDIASQYGVSVMRLREVNDLQGNQVHAGQKLRIPARSNNG